MPEELSEEKFTDRNKESGHDEKDKDVSEEVMLTKQNKKHNPKPKLKKNFILNKCSEIFHNNDNIKYKILEIDSDV